MREVVLTVRCDACRNEIFEETEGSNSIQLSIGGVGKELDMCNSCISGSFLQEARVVADKGKNFKCRICKKAFDTQRSLTHHTTVMHNKESK